jgi:hypothetical protein
MVGGIAVVTLGGTLRPVPFAAGSLLVGVIGALVGRRHTARAPIGRSARDVLAGLPSREKLAAGALIAVALTYLLIWLATYVSIPVHAPDGWSIWTRKAMVLSHYDGLARAFFNDPSYGFIHQDYPLLLSLLESVYFRFMGVLDTGAINAIFWLLLVSFLGALAYLASLTTRLRVWGAVVLAVLLAPLVFGQLSTAYADVPMGFFLGLGVLLLVRWTSSADSRELVLAAILLAAAGNLKDEGLVAALVAFVVAGSFVAWERRGPALLRLGGAAAAVAVALAPWRIWVAVEGIPRELPLGQGLSPTYLWDRADRVLPSAKALLWEVLKQGGWLVPATVVVLVVCVRTRTALRTGATYSLIALLVFCSIVWAFWVIQTPLDWQIAIAANRVVMGVVFVSIAALIDLGGAVDRHFAARRLSRPVTPRRRPRPSRSQP